MAGTVTTAAGPILSGIDVSHYQGTINWQAVAAAGTVFAYAKATEGLGSPDTYFAANWAAMQDAGLARGAYHFFHPAGSAQAQAARFLSVLTDLRAGDLPPMLDLEEAKTRGQDEWAAIPVEERVLLVLTWLQQVEQALGVRPVVYTRRGWVQQTLRDAGDLVNYPLWIAHYTDAVQPSIPNGWPRWTFWQYSESNSLNGINGNVDLDRFNGSLDDLGALASSTTGASPSTGN
jgi:lysozyme